MADGAGAPLVSVIMATYDGAEYLPETLATVDAQTYPNIEVVVADDGSTDGTLDLLAGHAPRPGVTIRVVPSEPRRGPVHQRNRAIDEARGPLLCWLDQDDLWAPTKVARQAAIMGDRPDVGLVYTRYEAFDSDTRRITWESDRRHDIDGSLLEPLLREGCFVHPLTAMFRRDALVRRHVRLPEDDPSLADAYYLWLAISLDWAAVCIPEALAWYRRHDLNLSTRILRTSNPYFETNRIIRDFVAEHPDARDGNGRVLRQSIGRNEALGAMLALRQRHPMKAVGGVARAIVRSPLYAAGSVVRFVRANRAVKRIGADEHTLASRGFS